MILLRGVGSWSEYVAVPSVNVMKLPVKADPVQAAMLKVNPLTALRMLEGIVSGAGGLAGAECRQFRSGKVHYSTGP